MFLSAYWVGWTESLQPTQQTDSSTQENMSSGPKHLQILTLPSFYYFALGGI